MSPWGSECTGPDVLVATLALNLQEENESKKLILEFILRFSLWQFSRLTHRYLQS